MRIHIIAIGGAVMHNLALELHRNGHEITGSDDEIYNPARDRLANAGILPTEFGWYPDKLDSTIDLVILGMHARRDNPELTAAQSLGLEIRSYPAFIFDHAKDKKRIVVAGSHGKTTTTSMIMHVMKCCDISFDYLVGAQLAGFDLMVRLSDAPWMVIEGDEYLASPIDLHPKMLYYHPHLAVLTGVEWDHMNVFPTNQSYLDQFSAFLQTIESGGKVFYQGEAPYLSKIMAAAPPSIECISYDHHAFEQNEKGISLIDSAGNTHPASVFGKHNLQNMQAAQMVLREVGISDTEITKHLATFQGAAKRLQVIARRDDSVAYLDFAHAPSKVRATVAAVREQYPNAFIRGVLELHTFSSLNPDFLVQYAHSLDALDSAVVFYDSHTLKMKQMADLNPQFVKSCFKNDELMVINQSELFKEYLLELPFKGEVTLIMSSGNLAKVAIGQLASEKLSSSGNFI